MSTYNKDNLKSPRQSNPTIVQAIKEENPTIETDFKPGSALCNKQRGARKLPEILEKKEEIIQKGDIVVAFFNPFHQKLFTAETSGVFDTKYGHYDHNKIVGQPFGTMIRSNCGFKFMYVLKPSRTTFTNNLKHRTQILYHMDIGSVINHLDVKPGDKIVETGTGSGSLSFSLSQQLGSSGHLFSFEFNKQRWETAKSELESLGCDNVTCTNRDAYNDGFILPGKLEEKQADGVFLDLPSPWLAVPHVKAILKRGGRVCNFSPCIEQVQKTILELSKVGFGNFQTIECVQRNYERRMTKRNNIYSGIDTILKNEAEYPEEEKSITQAQADIIKKRNYLPKNSREFHYEFCVGDGKWHTGYLTFGIKFKN